MPRKAKKQKDWLPEIAKPYFDKDGVQICGDDEPIVVQLNRFKYDRAIHGNAIVSCCDCGLTHTFTFEVFRDPKGQFGLNMRAMRHPKDETKPKKKKVRRKKNG